MSVKPGDKLSILLINDLPTNPKRQRKGFFPHDPYTLNLHTHGLEVSPLGISDNIFREMKPGTAHQILVDIPDDHPTGTFWYHPHKHGSVTFQFVGGMAGFLIIKGGPGTLDALLDDAGVKDIMGLQIIRTALNGGVPSPFVNEQAEQFGTYPFDNPTIEEQGIWSTYGVDGAPGRSFFYYTTNGATNPTLHMRPGEVQRWRLLNATEGDNLLLTLENHGLNIVAMDGITVEQMYQLKPEDPVVMGPGQRIDVLVKASDPGTYELRAMDPGPPTKASVSPYRDAQYPAGVDPEARASRHSFDFPTPCSPPGSAGLGGPKPIHNLGDSEDPCDARPQKKLAYPFPLATIVVDGAPIEMNLPAGPLPVPKGLPNVTTMLERTPDAVRRVAFEICGERHGTSMEDPNFRLPSCGWYFAKYDAEYWGGAPLIDLLMMRDDDDKGKPGNSPDMPLVRFKKDGLFNPEEPLFRDMIADNYEEWTVINRSFSDHPFHIHQNPVLVTKINGTNLPRPEWHDTLIVPGAIVPSAPPTGQPTGPTEPPFNAPAVNINSASFGSITFRTHFDPNTAGCFVMHCHTLSHEDIGMMQRVDVLPARGKRSGCVPEVMEHSSLEEIDWLLAGRVKFPVCSPSRQSEPTADGSGSLTMTN